MSGHAGHGHASSSSQQRQDTTFHLELPTNWEDYPISPVAASPIDIHDRSSDELSTIPEDAEEIIPARRPDEEYPIPVEPAPRRRQVQVTTLVVIGSTYLRRFATTSHRNVVESKLSVQLAVFFHLARTGHLKGVKPVTIDVFNKLAVNLELVDRQVSSDWRDLPDLIPCEIEGVIMDVVPSSIAVVQTFSRLFDLLNTRAHQSHPAREDNELEVIEFLQLYFTDVLNDTSTIEDFRIDYKKPTWTAIARMLSGSDIYPKLAYYLQNIDGEAAKQKALGVEGWIRTRMIAFLHSTGEVYTNQMLPTGEIAYRILKVWTKLRNVLIQVWLDNEDSQARNLVPWSLPTVAHSTSTSNVTPRPRPEHHTRSGEQESLWSFGENYIKSARTKTESGESHEVNGDLMSQITLLVHLEEVAKMPGVINPSAIFLAKHLVLDSALVFPNEVVNWSQRADLRRPSVRLDPTRKLSFVWPAFQVVQVLWRLGEIAQVGGDHQRVDKERRWAQLLQLFFIDVIDSCSALAIFHTKWDPRVWERIRVELRNSSQLGTAYRTIVNTDLDTLTKVAENVEEWVMSKIKARMEPAGEPLAHLHAALPAGEIATRIVRVWSRFRNAMIKAWQLTSDSDPRAQLPIWPVPQPPLTSNRRVDIEPNQAIQDAARRLSSSAAFTPSYGQHQDPRPLSQHDRRRSLPLNAIQSTSHSPIPRNHPHRQSLASPLPHTQSPPASPFTPPRSFTQPLPHRPNTDRPVTPLAVIHTIGGVANLPATAIPDQFKPKGRRLRDLARSVIGRPKDKGKRREDGGGDGDRREIN